MDQASIDRLLSTLGQLVEQNNVLIRQNQAFLGFLEKRDALVARRTELEVERMEIEKEERDICFATLTTEERREYFQTETRLKLANAKRNARWQAEDEKREATK